VTMDRLQHGTSGRIRSDTGLRIWLLDRKSELGTPLQRLLLPVRLPELNLPEATLAHEVEEQAKQTVAERTSAVVDELVTQEKEKEKKRQ